MNYLIGTPQNPFQINANFERIDSELTIIYGKFASLDIWKQDIEQQIATSTAKFTDIYQKVENINSDLARLQTEKVDKIENKEIVRVQNLLTGDALSVPNIQSVRDELDRLHSTPMLINEFHATDLQSCILTPVKENIITIPLDIGDYVFNGSLSFRGDEGSTAELFFEIDGEMQEISRIQFGGGVTYGNAPINAVLKIENDNTNISLRARRTKGINISINSNSIASSYLNFFKVN